MTDLTTSRFAELILEKLSLVVEIKQLVDKQKRLIDESKTDDLISLLAVKQQVVGKLQGNDRSLEPFRGQDPESRLWPNAETRAECQEHANLCEGVFREVLEIEAYCERAMSEFSEQTQRQLNGSVSARQATAAYQNFAPRKTSNIDFTSD